MDVQSVHSTHVYEPTHSGDGDDARMQLQAQLESFILDFRLDNNFVYRDQLRENALLSKYLCDVSINDLVRFDEELAHKLASEPGAIIPLFEAALRRCTRRIVFPHDDKIKVTDIPDHQLLLHSDADHVSIRNLDSLAVAKLVRVQGIVVGASPVSAKAAELHIQCRNCQHQRTLNFLPGITKVALPKACERRRVAGDPTPRCPLDPYFIVHEKSKFVDQQNIKLQESPDHVPIGDMPRHILICAERFLANRVVPGSKCTVMGILLTYQNRASGRSSTRGDVAIRTPYLRAVGIETDMHETARGSAAYTDEEEQEFLELSRRPNLFNVMAECVAPSIYGNRNIKKAILCLLLGGSKKILPDGAKLRGDIHVLLLGDPGTAKSQLLKFVERVAPISIYTSGKGSSAAGLTASVQRDQSTREFFLEGGAMVLADGGVVCIDEFDKMKDEDRVAIHEAMEQQTISIAKAGITTTLNSRTSVLAAANPVFGRYDDMKTPGENIDFQTTVLSRFDMIFIVRDAHSRERDETMAKHVMGIHKGRDADSEVAESEISVEKMRRYLAYCKSQCAPRLSSAAAEKLSSHFVALRRQVHAAEMEANTRSSIPITVRQLEAIIRITESLAKLTLSPIATEEHVDEAIKLFLCSTMDAVNQGSNQGSRELNEEVKGLEAELKRRLPIGWSTSIATLRREMVEGKGYSEQGLNRTLMIMQRRDAIAFRHAGAQVYRNGL